MADKPSEKNGRFDTGLIRELAAILREGPESAEVLFIRRSEQPGDPWSGHMAFPGGRQAPTDRELLDTARRETLEEIGLKNFRSATWNAIAAPPGTPGAIVTKLNAAVTEILS